MRYVKIGLFLLLAAGAMCGQSFEVAAVRPVAPHTAASARGLEISGDRVHIGPMILWNLIAVAYGVQNYQVQGPAWLTAITPAGFTLFDVDAKTPGVATRPAVLEMLRNLLAERFGLRVEIGSTDANAFALTVAKDGPRFRQLEAGAVAPEPAKDYQGIPLVQMGGIKVAIAPDGSRHVEASNIRGVIFFFTTMYTPTPFLDETGLTGQYDIKLDIPPSDFHRGDPGDAREREMVAASAGVAKQGLKLEPRKTAIKAIIVKNVEKEPTPN